MFLKNIIESANTGLDAIQRAPIVLEDTGLKCLRIQDISQSKDFDRWGNTIVSEENYKAFSLKKDDIIIARTGSTIGVNFFVSKNLKSVYNNGLIRLRVDTNKALPYFVYCYLQTKQYSDFIESISGSSATQPNMRINDLLELKIPDKTLTEQQHIVDTIGSVDNLIEKYEDLYLKIQEFLILKYTQLQSQEGLKVVDIFKCFNGGTFKSADYVETSNKKLVTIKNIDATGFNLQDITYLKDNLDCEKYALRYGDILLTMTGAYLGRCGIVSEKNCYQNQRILKVVGESKAFTYVFLKVNEKAIFSLGKGSAQPNLSLQDFYQMKVPYSTLDIKQFKQYDNLFDMMLNIKLKQQKAKQQKQTLLQKYFG